ncbi:MAG: GNAT family N-acetyltransferase [Spirochaetes bacterium]|nr:GNAT family N-acetyltransferase [Spirochaetota bacterium]MBU1079023.1 GNAT family N-acetyltransferase [Spirochaetota bacterium]
MEPKPILIDALARADDLASLWNASAGREFPLDRRLLTQQLTMDTDPRRCLAFAEPDGSLAAAILAKRAARPGASGETPPVGYISFLAVAPARRRRGLGTALADEAGAWLASTGAARIRVGSDHYHLLPGRPVEAGEGYDALGAFLRARGFRDEGAEYDLVSDLSAGGGRPVDGRRSRVDPRYTFRPYRPGEREAVVAFMRGNFPGRWAQEIEEALDAGMRPSDLFLAVDSEDGAVVGFSRVYDGSSPVLGPGVYWRGIMGEAPGGLGPIGVDASRRGAGIGLGLLQRCVDELRSRGVGIMVIDWTDLIDFYGKIGFKVWKRYEAMSAEIGRPLR